MGSHRTTGMELPRIRDRCRGRPTRALLLFSNIRLVCPDLTRQSHSLFGRFNVPEDTAGRLALTGWFMIIREIRFMGLFARFGREPR